MYVVLFFSCVKNKYIPATGRLNLMILENRQLPSLNIQSQLFIRIKLRGGSRQKKFFKVLIDNSIELQFGNRQNI